MTQETFILSESSQDAIDRCLLKYPQDQKQSALVSALLIAQNQNHGWLSPTAIHAVAEYLQLPLTSVYEVATFYDLLYLKPVGKHIISVCTNISCLLRGCDQILECIYKRLHIRPGETTTDGQFTLKEVECMAACASAPMCQLDDRNYHTDLTTEKMLTLIDQLSEEKK